MRSPAGNQKRKQRNERFRENQAANGLKQISITVPASLTDRFKALAKWACDTGSFPEQPELIDGLAPQAATPRPASGAPSFAQLQVEHRALMEQAVQLEARLTHEEGMKHGLQRAHAEEMLRLQTRYDCAQQYLHSLKAQLRQAAEETAMDPDNRSPWTNFLGFGSGFAIGAMVAIGLSLAFWRLMSAS